MIEADDKLEKLIAAGVPREITFMDIDYILEDRKLYKGFMQLIYVEKDEKSKDWDSCAQ